MTKAALLVLLVVGCGSVTAKEGADASAGAGGALEATGGAAGELGGRGGRPAGAAGAGGAGGSLEATGGAAGQGETCLDANAQGFTFNTSDRCDAGNACFASCAMNGSKYVGCVGGSPIASRCYASCSDCP